MKENPTTTQPPAGQADEPYVIYSKCHSRGEMLWWNPNSAGYTRDLNHAGRYSAEEALAIQHSTHGDSVAVAVAQAESLPSVRVVDLGFRNTRDLVNMLIGGAK